MLNLIYVWIILVYVFGWYSFADTYYLGTREKLLRYLFLPVSLSAFVVSFLLAKLAYFLFFEFEK